MSVNLDIQQENSYPLLKSGSVTFSRISDPDIRTKIDCTQEDALKPYGADSILMDTGATLTLIPVGLADALQLEEPKADSERWVITMGVGGVNIGYVPEEPIALEITGKHNALVSNDIYPVVYLGCAPVFSAISEHLEKFKRPTFPKCVLPFVLLPYKVDRNKFGASVAVPDEECALLEKRPCLSDPATNTGLSFVIIGRDWQRKFKLVFQEKALRID